MKNIIFFTVLLVLWIAGSSCYYVCKIRNDCYGQFRQSEVSVPEVSMVPDTLTASPTVTEKVLPPAFTIWFKPGANDCVLSATDRQNIALVKTYIAENMEGKINLTGHADNTGSEEINMRISLLRAESVKQRLIEAGIPATNIILEAKGELGPISDNDSEEGRAKNRSVVIQTY